MIRITVAMLCILCGFLAARPACAQQRREHAPRVGTLGITDEFPRLANLIESLAGPTPDPETTLDLDEYAMLSGDQVIVDAWDWQLFPNGLIYRPYMASRKEPRLAGYIVRSKGDSTFWEGMAGAQVGVVRFGNHDPYYPEGYQLDVEAAADIRLDIPNEVDVRGTDYRVGLPFSYGFGKHRIRFGYYHVSSHLGDEFLLANPGYQRLNFSRDALILGGLFFLDAKTRIYGETGWAFHSEFSEPWEFQFGVDHGPYLPTGIHGECFWGVHGHLREELDFGGSVSAQIGWAWVGESGNRFRAGVQYYNGGSNQYSFYEEHEQVIGVGIWYDL